MVMLVFFITVVVHPLVQPIGGLGAGSKERLVCHGAGQSKFDLSINLWERPPQLVVSQT